MMENLLSTSSSMIETSSVTGQSERVFPATEAEFDGETVLCRVCGDRASGFHYGVHACEGCKGFFRRSIQQKIQYRPCLKNQQCNIQRVNRNRCQYCRLKKCISVGMSRDAVRFGRVPKKEKARIIEQMQKKCLTSQVSELNSLLANDLDVVQAVVAAHHQTCDITQLRAHQMRDVALHKQEYINCPANMACPLNNEIGMDSNANRNNLSDFSESFTPAIKSVVDFAKGIPGFVLLNQDDQVTLLKAGTFEVLLVRLACLFDPHSNTMMFTGGKLFKRQSSAMTTNAGFLLDSMFDFAERFNKMCLVDDEIALFSAVVLLSPDRPGLRNIEQVEKIQNKLTEALQSIVNTNHKEDGTLFAKLLMKTTDLRTLNTLHSEKSIAGQQRSSHERGERQNTDDSDMDFQDSLSTRSSRSSPTLSETSNMTMTSSYSGETDGGGIVIGQRLPLDASGHQVVLRTPYGTFFREEMSGFYGLMAEQPRRRCNTLDRDTLSRPRLHTIEEGNRRRYTLDRDYINKMANRLSDRLETRSAIKGDSLPPSMSNSATSSPIQEEGSAMYHVPSSASFAPITVPDSIMAHPSAIVTRTSPLAGTEAILGTSRTVSSPASPKSRSRSGSFTQDEYANARPRCYSFHLNSEGRAARMTLQRRMLAEQGHERDNQTSPEGNPYLSPEMRRGSVGAVYGLHNRKPSSLVDRSLAYIRGRYDVEKAVDAEGRPLMKHIMPDGSVYGIKLTSDLAAQHAGLWHQHATLAMGMAPPISVPIMQRSREDLARPISVRSREWDFVNTQSREMPQEVLPREVVKNLVNDHRTSPEMILNESFESQMMKSSKINSVKLEKTGIERSTMAAPQQPHIHLVSMAGSGSADFAERKNSFHEVKPAGAISAIEGGIVIMDSLTPAVRSKASSPEVNSSSRSSSLRGSPVGEDFSSETFGHKKFDKFRKDKVQNDSTSSTPTEDYVIGVKVREKTESMRIKEEKMEEEDDAEQDIDDKELKIDVSEMKTERKSPYGENLSPAVSSSSTPSPNSDRPKLSAREAHPNLLAHLMNGGSTARQASPRLPCTPASVAIPLPANVSVVFPWAMSPHLNCGPHAHPQAQMFRHPFVTSQNSGFAGLAVTSPSSSLSSSSSSTQPPVPHFPSAADQYNSSANLSTHLNISSQQNGNSDQKCPNSKEDVHATAVSHLKDKILRKYDSMENLSKIGKDASSAPAVGTGSTTNPCTPNQSQWSKSSSTVQAALSSSTADLNKELATKLTLSPSTLPSGTITTSFPPSPPSTAAFSTQRLACPFTNHISSTSSAPASQAGPPSRYLPSGSISQLSHMLLSQDPHPSSLPMYHSMLSQQYPKHRNSLTAPTNNTPTSQSPLANMQHFAQMFVHGQMVAAADASDKRLDLSSPLNLTSKMEDGRLLSGSTTSSHNPQTPA